MIVNIIIVADDGKKTAILDLVGDTVKHGTMSMAEAADTARPHLQKFLDKHPAKAHAAT